MRGMLPADLDWVGTVVDDKRRTQLGYASALDKPVVPKASPTMWGNPFRGMK